MSSECLCEFIDQFHREFIRLAAERDHARTQAQQNLDKINRDIHKLIEAIKEGVPGSAVKDEMAAVEAHKKTLERGHRARTDGAATPRPGGPVPP